VAISAVGGVSIHDFPQHLRGLAEYIITFLEAVNYFPETMNRDVRTTLDSLNLSMLSYRASLIVSPFLDYITDSSDHLFNPALGRQHETFWGGIWF
jgi:hypothetical protein